MTQFWNIIENVDFETVLATFGQKTAISDFSRKIGLRHFFAFIEPKLHAKNQKKLMNQFWEKVVTDWLTDVNS